MKELSAISPGSSPQLMALQVGAEKLSAFQQQWFEFLKWVLFILLLFFLFLFIRNIYLKQKNHV